MPKFLANENVPADAIEAARLAGFDIASISEQSPGINDEAVQSQSLTEERVLVTFDKDFGEMAFKQGLKSNFGVILLRPRLHSPEFLGRFLVAVLSENIDWQGHFAVAREGKLRVVPLPE